MNATLRVHIFVALLLPLASWADQCTLPAVASASAAALTMVGSYKQFKQLVSVSAVTKLQSQLVVDLRSESWLKGDRTALRTIAPGDRVTLTYSADPHLWQANQDYEEALYRLRHAEATFAKGEFEEATHQLMAATRVRNRKLMNEAQDVINGVTKERREALKALARALDTVRGAKEISLRKVGLSKSSAAEVAEHLRQMDLRRLSVYSVERVPRASVLKLLKLTPKSGLVALGAVLGLGLLSTEQLAAGALACYREDELAQLKSNP